MPDSSCGGSLTTLRFRDAMDNRKALRATRCEKVARVIERRSNDGAEIFRLSSNAIHCATVNKRDTARRKREIFVRSVYVQLSESEIIRDQKFLHSALFAGLGLRFVSSINAYEEHELIMTGSCALGKINEIRKASERERTRVIKSR